MAGAFCPACGRRAADEGHEHCVVGGLEPPRFCDRCGTRLDVQVYPTGFVATCRRCDGIHPARRGQSTA